MDAVVTLSGPLFDGRAAGILDRAAEELVRTLTDRGYQRLTSPMPDGVPVKSGRLQSGITETVQGLHGQIDPGGIEYAGWIEGVTPRNQSTRFKGYQNYERAASWLEGRVSNVAGDVLERALKELGG